MSLDYKAQPSVVGIIAEYNPFHNGHAYQIQKAKELSGARYCIAAMSGNFVQRGAPAIFDKHSRAKMALLSGADLVLEIPPYFAVSSAEDFASCGVAMLDRLGVVTHLCFGSECGDITSLWQLARLLNQEPSQISERLKESMKQGLTYPHAREQAVLQYLKTDSDSGDADAYRMLLSSPNNILGIEYCKAIQSRNSSMIPITVTRQGHGYHDQRLGQEFSSATAIRQRLKELYPSVARPDHLPSFSEETTLLGQVPGDIRELFQTCKPLFAEDFSPLLSYRLLELQAQDVPFQHFLDVTPDLADRINRQILDFAAFDEKVSRLKTRQFTYTRISRCLMHILLNMTEEDYQLRKSLDYLSYIRILGFRRQSADLLSAVKKNCRLPLITKTADAARRLDDRAFNQFKHDIFCSHVYQAVYEQTYKEQVRNEYTQPIVII